MNNFLNFLIGPFGVILALLAVLALVAGMLAPFLAESATAADGPSGTPTVVRTRSAIVLEYLVRWRGYPPEEDTWEPLASLRSAKDALADYHNNQRASGD